MLWINIFLAILVYIIVGLFIVVNDKTGGTVDTFITTFYKMLVFLVGWPFILLWFKLIYKSKVVDANGYR